MRHPIATESKSDASDESGHLSKLDPHQPPRTARTPEAPPRPLATPGVTKPDQWQAQIQALIQQRADVRVYSSLDAETLRAAHLTPCEDISAMVAAELERHGPESRVAVLPQGPLTIPYLTE